MDALQQVLHAIRLKPQVFRRYEFSQHWGIQLSTTKESAFHLVERGTCWLRMESLAYPLQVETGDLIVVSNTQRYELVDDPHTSASLPLSHFNPGGSMSAPHTTLIYGEFCSERDVIYPLFSLLPPLIHIPNDNGQPIYWLATALQGIASEAESGRPGYQAVISRLMDILFIMVTRYWIDHHTPEEGGWLSALYDPQIGTALNVIHRQPGDQWTLEALAHTAFMSRSAFSERFTALVGEPPMRYLTRWRMQLTTVWLTDDRDLTIEQAAYRAGYSSSYAFSKAFKRWVGISPTEYRQKQPLFELSGSSFLD